MSNKASFERCMIIGRIGDQVDELELLVAHAFSQDLFIIFLGNSANLEVAEIVLSVVEKGRGTIAGSGRVPSMKTSPSTIEHEAGSPLELDATSDTLDFVKKIPTCKMAFVGGYQLDTCPVWVTNQDGGHAIFLDTGAGYGGPVTGIYARLRDGLWRIHMDCYVQAQDGECKIKALPFLAMEV